MKRLLFIIVALLFSTPLYSQTPTKLCIPTNTAGTNCINITSTFPLPVTGTITATNPSVSATGAAVPASATYIGVNSSGNIVGLPGDVTNGAFVNVKSTVALPANQSVNISQINAVTPLMGNGVTGTGSQRVTIASDNTAFTVNLGTIGTVSTAANQTSVIGTLAAGTSATNSQLVGRVYTATAPTLTNGQQIAAQSDLKGSQYTNGEGRKTTYSVAANFSPTGTSATDVFYINGSASVTIRVNRFQCSGIATAASSTPVTLLIRNTANSGGTCAGLSPVSHDSNNAAVSATVTQCTANPTVGSLVSNVRRQYMDFGTSTAQALPIIWDFSNRNGQAIVLRGTGQLLAFNLGSASLTGVVLACDIEWTEE